MSTEESTRWGEGDKLTVNVYFLQRSVWAWVCQCGAWYVHANAMSMGVAVVCMNGWDHTCCFKTTSQTISGANFRFLWKRSGLHWSGSALAEHNRATIPVWKCKETGRELALGNSVVLIIMTTNYNLYSKQFETLCNNSFPNDCILFLLTIYTVSQLFLEWRVGLDLLAVLAVASHVWY